ncbi:MAG: hypothetical protein L3K02_07680 [Thermoplasmata archaeon]|nr:hypothetical protein [Thermoplasmata archaeon]
MLRGNRSGDSGPSGESFRDTARSHHELLLAVAPLPDAPEFRIAGWPQWLMPGHLSLSRAVRSRNLQDDPH